MGGRVDRGSYHIGNSSSMKKIRTYRWHSINIIPIIGCYSISADDSIKIIGQAIEITILGRVFVFTYPSKKLGKMWCSPVYGPLWSRKRKKIYFV